MEQPEKHLWLPTMRDGSPAMICPCRKVWRVDRNEPKGPCSRYDWMEAQDKEVK